MTQRKKYKETELVCIVLKMPETDFKILLKWPHRSNDIVVWRRGKHAVKSRVRAMESGRRLAVKWSTYVLQRKTSRAVPEAEHVQLVRRKATHTTK